LSYHFGVNLTPKKLARDLLILNYVRRGVFLLVTNKDINKEKKMLSKRLLTAMALVTLSSAFSYADSPSLGTPGYAGSGCRAGTASVTLSPDFTALSILFDNYIGEAGGSTGKPMDRKSCNIAVPVHVPQGYSVSLIKIDYRGFAAIPQGGRGVFRAEYFWAGVRGPDFLINRQEPYNGNFLLQDELIASAVVWSPCGQSINLRVNTSTEIYTNRSREQAMLTIDSADISTGLLYHLQWRRCQ